MNDREKLRAEFDAEFLKDLAAAAGDGGEDRGAAAQAETAGEDRGAAAGEKSQSSEEDKLAGLAPFTRAVVATIRAIPAGRVMSYGQVAAASGSPRGARQVVRILHTLSRKYALPWHRVVNIRGEIALDEDGGGSEQQLRLEAEGVEFGLADRIDLSRYRHEADPGAREESGAKKPGDDSASGGVSDSRGGEQQAGSGKR